MNFKFIPKLLGHQVLYVKERKPGPFPGDWEYYYRKANQDDVVEFMTEIAVLQQSIEQITELKKSHPELFI